MMIACCMYVHMLLYVYVICINAPSTFGCKIHSHICTYMHIHFAYMHIHFAYMQK